MSSENNTANDILTFFSKRQWQQGLTSMPYLSNFSSILMVLAVETFETETQHQTQNLDS